MRYDDVLDMGEAVEKRSVQKDFSGISGKRWRKNIKDLSLWVLYGLGHIQTLKGVPILAYHSIDTSNSYLSISPAIFKRQMDYLKSVGIQGISLAQLLKGPITKKFSGTIVVLTFDDGLRNFYEEAWPVLGQNGFSATVFVPTDFIGEQSWWYSRYGLRPMSMLTWQDIRELASSGMDIQSHGCSHRKLTDLSSHDVQYEMRESKKILEQELSIPVESFCYPFGEVSQEIVGVVRDAGYRAATCMEQGLFREGDDLYLMKRLGLDYISIQDERTALLSMKTCMQGTFAWYVTIKRRIKVLLEQL
jgi:peptidoglycan/xylan/chitin deacetylase (PgdA/CDA1 family)